MERRTAIKFVSQDEYESLSEAWERSKLLLCKCPNNNMKSTEKLTHFISELTTPSEMFLDASLGGTLRTKSDDKVKILIKNVC